MVNNFVTSYANGVVEPAGNNNQTGSIISLNLSDALTSLLTSRVKDKALSFWWKKTVPVSVFAVDTEFQACSGGTRSCGNWEYVQLERATDLAKALFIRSVLPGLGVEDPENPGKILTDAAKMPAYEKQVGFQVAEMMNFTIGSQEVDAFSSNINQIISTIRTPKGRQFVEMSFGYDDPLVRAKLSSQPVLAIAPIYFWWTYETQTPLRLVAFSFLSARVGMRRRTLNQLIVVPEGAGYELSDVRQRPYYVATKLDNPDLDNASNLRDLSDADVGVSFIIDYVLLGSDERLEMANRALCDVIVHTSFLVQQVTQDVQPGNYGTGRQVRFENVRFNTPVREIGLVFAREEDERANLGSEFLGVVNPVTGLMEDPIASMSVELNGQSKIFADPQYFRLVQPFQYHTTLPQGYVYLYSLNCLNGDSLAYSGALASSKLDTFSITAYLKGINWYTSDDGLHYNRTVNVLLFAMQHNLLCSSNGTAATSFSN